MPKTNKNLIALGEESVEVKPCKVFESDIVLTEPVAIDYYKSCIKEFEAYNMLLGTINEEGEYVIGENIRRDLALLPKEQIAEGYHLIEALSRIKGKDLFFVIEIDEEVIENANSLVGSLFVIEKVAGYEGVDSLKTFVAKIIQPVSDKFVDKAKAVFNIQTTLGDFDDAKFADLLKQLNNQYEDWLILEDIIDLSSQIYIMRILQLLEEEGELGQAVISAYNKQIKEQGFAGNSRYIELRKVLDSVIEQHGGIDKVFKKNKEKVSQAKTEYSTAVRQVEKYRQKQASAKAKAQKTAKTAKVEKKPEAKSAGKSAGKHKAKGKDKKAGGKKAKGKDKKKDKKKDDKKKDKKKDNKKKWGPVKETKLDSDKSSSIKGAVADVKSNKPYTPVKIIPGIARTKNQEAEDEIAMLNLTPLNNTKPPQVASVIAEEVVMKKTTISVQVQEEETVI